MQRQAIDEEMCGKLVQLTQQLMEFVRKILECAIGQKYVRAGGIRGVVR